MKSGQKLNRNTLFYTLRYLKHWEPTQLIDLINFLISHHVPVEDNNIGDAIYELHHWNYQNFVALITILLDAGAKVSDENVRMILRPSGFSTWDYEERICLIKILEEKND